MGCKDLILIRLICGRIEDYVPPPPPADPKDKPFVINHDNRALAYWDRLIIVIIVISLFIVPLRIGFSLGTTMSEYVWWLIPDIIMDLTFVADIVLSFFKTYDDTGEKISDRFLIARRYVRGSFALDCLSTFPFDYLYLAARGDPTPWARINRMLRLRRLLDFLMTWELNTSMKPSVTGILKIVFIVLFISHLVGCIFHGVTVMEGSSWMFTSTRNPMLHMRPLYIRYLRSFFWALLTLTGYNASNPQVFSEIMISCVLTICSVFLFGTIIGSFGNLLTTLDSSMVFFRQKQDIMLDYMAYKKIPWDLQQDVRKFYTYMWESGKGLHQNEAVDRLPLMLRQKMDFFMNYPSIRKVYLFAGVEDDMDFMGEIVRCLRLRIGIPNAYIVKKGEYGTEMYFISRGELNVINDDGKVIFTLSDGMFFGEIALLYKTKRTASIVARTFCDMYVLTRDEFRKVMRKYPTQSKGIKDVAKKRCNAMVVPTATDNTTDDDEEHNNRSMSPGSGRRSSIRRSSLRRSSDVGNGQQRSPRDGSPGSGRRRSSLRRSSDVGSGQQQSPRDGSGRRRSSLRGGDGQPQTDDGKRRERRSSRSSPQRIADDDGGTGPGSGDRRHPNRRRQSCVSLYLPTADTAVDETTGTGVQKSSPTKDSGRRGSSSSGRSSPRTDEHHIQRREHSDNDASPAHRQGDGHQQGGDISRIELNGTLRSNLSAASPVYDTWAGTTTSLENTLRSRSDGRLMLAPLPGGTRTISLSPSPSPNRTDSEARDTGE